MFRASGATPKKDTDDYYSDKENGIPFIRVQNLSVTGELDTNDLVYISKEVHEGMLKRSQVKAHDLLVKITGVGRMAVASVVPDGFEGNINQHIVVIRTESKETSQNLAAFLNLDSIEKIASKRATGGTRPALDYAALFSIPVINRREVYEIINQAVSFKRAKEAEAQRLLDSIDDYLLEELGIELPEQEENTIQSRIFTRRFSEISGGRFDAPVHHKKYFLTSSSFPMQKLKDCVLINPATSFLSCSPDIDVSFIPMEKLSDQHGEAEISDCRALEQSGGYTKFQDNDLLWAKITPCMQNGKSAVVNGLKNGFGFGSTEFHVFKTKKNIDIRYIHALFRLVSLRKHAVLYFSGSAGHQRVSDDFFKKMSIPLPPLEKQTEIADHIAQIRSRAKQLQQEAVEGLEQAKLEVEALLLGNA